MHISVPNSLFLTGDDQLKIREVFRLFCTNKVLILCIRAYCLTLCSGILFAFQTQAQSFTATEFGQRQGLVANEVFDILAMSDNRVFLGTENGLFSFNGNTFWKFGKTEGLAASAVIHLSHAPQDKLFLSTIRGLYAYDGSAFTNSDWMQSFDQNLIYGTKLLPDKMVYVACDKGFYRIKNNQIEKIILPKGVAGFRFLDFAMDQTGWLYLQTDHGSFAVKGNVIQSLPEAATDFVLLEDGKIAYYSEPFLITCLNGKVNGKTEISDIANSAPVTGSQWIVVPGNKLFFYHSGTWGKLQLGDIKTDIEKVVMCPDGQIWGITGNSLLKLHRSYCDVQTINGNKYPQSFDWGNISESAFQFYTSDNIIYRKANGSANLSINDAYSAEKVERKFGAGKIFASNLMPDGDLWMVHEHAGIIVGRGGQLLRADLLYPSLKGLSCVFVSDIGTEKLALVGESGYRELHLKTGALQTFDYGISMWPVHFISKGNRTCISGVQGVCIFENGKRDFLPTSLFGNASGIKQVELRGNCLWMNLLDAGIVCWDLSHKRILKNLNTANGMPELNPGFFTIDQHNNMWIAFRNRLCHVQLQGNPVYSIVDNKSGLPEELFDDCLLSDGAGDLYFKTPYGYGVFHTETYYSNPVQWIPEILLNQLFSGNKAIAYNSLNHRHEFDLKLEAGNGNLRLLFESVIPVNPDNIFYQYRIQERDTTWINAGNSGNINISGLSVGRYNIEFRSGTHHGNWSPVYKLKLRIFPHWWESWWAIALYFFTGIALVYWIVNRRFRQMTNIANLQRENLENKLIGLRSQINPHFISNILQSIQLAVLTNETEKAANMLESYSKIMRQGFENTALDQVSLEQEMKFIEAFVNLERNLLSRPLEYSVTYSQIKDPETIFIPCMILQPIVENSFVHGLRHCKEDTATFKVNLILNGNSLHVRLEDNGPGFQNAASQKRISGLEISRERLRLYGEVFRTYGEITLDSGMCGTKIDLELPVIFKDLNT